MMKNQDNTAKKLFLRSIGAISPARPLARLVTGAALAWLALSPTARSACRQGCDIINSNTFLGDQALVNNSTGFTNTAIGANALSSNDNGAYNTAIGYSALISNTAGNSNTASGYQALWSNSTGGDNTALGSWTLFSNNTGSSNIAIGDVALTSNTTGNQNTATGNIALYNNTTGNQNTATGYNALSGNTTGLNNTASGVNALSNNTTGNGNIALGFNAGLNLTTGSGNIDIGSPGTAGESRTIRLGKIGSQTNTFIAGINGVTVAGGVGVIIDTNGHLGTVVSSERFKENVQPMDKASEAILALKPVSFHYKQEIDPDSIPQFGLVAEEVDKVNPDLVARDADGKAYTVRYEAVNAMLLNEFLKAHHKVEALEKAMAEQQKENAAMRAMLKEQAAQIQKVSAQLATASPFRGGLETTNRAPQIVLNNQ
jgi:hypothetical protein